MAPEQFARRQEEERDTNESAEKERKILKEQEPLEEVKGEGRLHR